MCIYCGTPESTYVGTVWDRDLGAYCEEWACDGCGAVHGEYLAGEPFPSPDDDTHDDDIDPDELYQEALEESAGNYADAELDSIMGDESIPEADRLRMLRETIARLIAEHDAGDRNLLASGE